MNIRRTVFYVRDGRCNDRNVARRREKGDDGKLRQNYHFSKSRYFVDCGKYKFINTIVPTIFATKPIRYILIYYTN